MFKNSLNKIDISKNLNKKTGLSVNFSKKLINDLIEILIENIKDGELILKNIGTFRVIKKKERIGRNPKTKEEFIIDARNSVTFKASKKLSNNLTKNHE